MSEPAPSRAAPSLDARCAEHADCPASIICARCGSYACDDCRYEGEDYLEYCARCISRAPPLATQDSRLIAAMVDNFVVVLPALMVILYQDLTYGASLELLGGPLIPWAMMSVLGMCGLQLVLVVRNGQSLGKRLMRIRVVRTDGRPAELWRLVLLRTLLPVTANKLLGYPAMLDVLFIFTRKRRCLHDLLADTKVVKVNAHTR